VRHLAEGALTAQLVVEADVKENAVRSSRSLDETGSEDGRVRHVVGQDLHRTAANVDLDRPARQLLPQCLGRLRLDPSRRLLAGVPKTRSEGTEIRLRGHGRVLPRVTDEVEPLDIQLLLDESPHVVRQTGSVTHDDDAPERLADLHLSKIPRLMPEGRNRSPENHLRLERLVSRLPVGLGIRAEVHARWVGRPQFTSPP
jgi:hypothetical protein